MVRLRHGSKQDRPFIRYVKVSCTGIDISYGNERQAMRFAKVGGTLVFKWSDVQINVKNLLKIIPYKPLFGQQRGTTHWITFVKFEEATFEHKNDRLGIV